MLLVGMLLGGLHGYRTGNTLKDTKSVSGFVGSGMAILGWYYGILSALSFAAVTFLVFAYNGFKPGISFGLITMFTGYAATSYTVFKAMDSQRKKAVPVKDQAAQPVADANRTA